MQSVTPTPATIVPASTTRRGRVSKFLIPEIIFGIAHVMRFNAETHADRYVDVAGALGIRTAGLDARTAAERAIDCVQALSTALGIPSGLQEIGVDPADFDAFAVNALRDAYIATNPRPVDEDDVRRICIAAY